MSEEEKAVIIEQLKALEGIKRKLLELLKKSEEVTVMKTK